MKLFKVALISFVVGLSGAVMPGPLFAIAVQQALVVGWTAGFWLINGHAVGELILLILIRYGAGNFLKHPLVSKIIGILGGTILLYFAYNMILTVINGNINIDVSTNSSLSIWKLMSAGFLISITNPTWYIWWATAGIGLITNQMDKNGNKAWPAFFVGHITADYAWYLLVTIILSTSKKFITLYVHQAIIIICAASIVAIGCVFIIKAFTNNLSAIKDAS